MLSSCISAFQFWQYSDTFVRITPCKDGQGIERWGDGSIFTGSFKDGRTANEKKSVSFVVSIKIQRKVSEANPFARKHGHGKFMWGEGCMYEAPNLQKGWETKLLSDLEFEFIVRKPAQGNFINNDMHGEGKGRIPCLPVLEQKDEPIHLQINLYLQADMCGPMAGNSTAIG